DADTPTGPTRQLRRGTRSGAARPTRNRSAQRWFQGHVWQDAAMPPAWLQFVSAVYVSLSIPATGPVAGDIVALGRRQQMPIMAAVWTPLCCTGGSGAAAGYGAPVHNRVVRVASPTVVRKFPGSAPEFPEAE